MFHVRQKVVCIDASNRSNRVWLRDKPVEGQVYTVSEVGLISRIDGEPLIRLVELKNSTLYLGYAVRRFRPVAERKTDISVFTKMLKPKRAKQSA